MSAANLPSVDPLPHHLWEGMIRIRARRAARATAGIVGVFGAALTALVALVFPESYFPTGSCTSVSPGLSTFTLLGTWGGMLLVYGFAYLGERAEARRQQGESFAGYLSIHQNERGAIFWPMAAVSLLAPLTIHFLAFALVRMNSPDFPEAYDSWIVIAGGLTIPAHGALVYCCWRFARELVRPGTNRAATAQAGWRALGVTTLAGLVPGAILFLVPPLIVLVTGFVFIPWMFAVMSDRHFSDREELDDLERTLAQTAAEEAFLRAQEVLLGGRSSAERIGALRFLTHHFDRACARRVLDQAVRSTDAALAREAVLACLELHHRPPWKDLDALARRATDLAGADVARLLGYYREDQLARRTLARMVELGSAGVRREAVRSLGKVGALEDVQLLRRTALRYLSERGIENVIEAAVKRIQDRHAKGPAGALALAGETDAEGDLSITEDAEGAVSPATVRSPACGY